MPGPPNAGSACRAIVCMPENYTLVDQHWRGLTVTDDIVIDSIPINVPASLLREMEPEAYDLLNGTESDRILLRPLMDVEPILQQPMEAWHYRFDPTWINIAADTFRLGDEIAGAAVSAWVMGESSIMEDIKIEEADEATIILDQTYVIRSTQSEDTAMISVIGFGILGTFDGLEVMAVAQEPSTCESRNGFLYISPLTTVFSVAAACIFLLAWWVLTSRKDTGNGSTQGASREPTGAPF